MEKYDLVVIGAGPGGTPAAMAAAQFGKKVLLVDKRDAPGGECLFEGCIPSKVLENAANRFAMFRENESFHIETDGKEQIHWDAVLKDKDDILERRSQAALKQIENMPTLTFRQGTASFEDEHTISLDGEKIAFDYAIIATGASPHLPPIKGNGVAKAWTNAEVFKNKKIPDEVAFIGAGAINCELVQMFNKLGTRCHLFERGSRILKRIDEECASMIQKKMQEDGIDLHLNVIFDSIEGEEGNFTLKYAVDGTTKELKTPHVLIATGRTANTEGLGLEKIGIDLDHNGIFVQSTLQTSQPHIYAVGDCNTGPKFAHWASYEAGIAIHNIFAPSKHHVNKDKLSWVLFSDPQIASAGIRVGEARSRGMEVDIERYDYRVDARAQLDKAETGLLKFVIERKTGIIRGVQILSEDASALSGEAAMIVANKMTVMDIIKTIHPHPTLTESFGRLAQQVFMRQMMQRGRAKQPEGGHLG